MFLREGGLVMMMREKGRGKNMRFGGFRGWVGWCVCDFDEDGDYGVV